MFKFNMSVRQVLAIRWTLLCIVLVFCFLGLPAAHARPEVKNGDVGDPSEFQVLSDPKKPEVPKCKIRDNDALYSIMDKVCELCHDMYSHQNPDLMSQCRSQCYRHPLFKKCLHLFTPGSPNPPHHKLRH